ncbi:ester cyclase [Telluria beijingensis]|uniref:nuclear transport factor 2 family protein n=1 Tax=Telluria beijingensis TaxID=3068633 RepID=UPI0027957187|nr:ester cyclase [Massilia sp. REN29]
MSIDEQLSCLRPSAYAPYRNPREYITAWTDRIWINRGLGQIHEMYAPDVKVHTSYGETYGMQDVIGNSVQKMVAFSNRGGGHDDVIWESRGDNGFISSHRVFNNAVHDGHWTYGPPTGRQWYNRSVAHCLVQDNVVTEEWVVRDEFAVLEGLGMNPYLVAAELAQRSPVLGNAIVTGEEAGSFAGRIANAAERGVSGARPARYAKETRLIQDFFDEVWNGRHVDRVNRFCDNTVVCQSVRMRRVMQIANYQLELMSLLAAFPDGKMEIRDIAVHDSIDLGLRVAVLWLLRGSYKGAPVYGKVNGAPVTVMGISHFELRDDRIIREYRIFDEISVISQIIKHGNGWEMPA